MGLNFSNKIVDKNKIKCGEKVKVTLSLSASPNITENPTDIALILDRSGSMTGQPLIDVKNAAKEFIDIIDEATDGLKDGNIGGGSKIGIVSFSTQATQDTQLITNVSQLKTSIDQLTAGGLTNHADAFKKAIELFDPLSTNSKVIIMFTDGKTTTGTDPSVEAALARSMGITIYCIGLNGDGGIDITALNDWATDPDSSHVFIAPTSADLEQLFIELALNITKTGATNIVIDEIINDGFEIVDLFPATKGTANLINSTTIKWTIDKLGVTNNEGASLSFNAKYTGNQSVSENINKSISYTDTEGNVATFQNPIIDIECDIIIPEECPTPFNIVFDGCKEFIDYDLGDIFLSSTGRILDLNLELKNICPNKRVALAVTVTEKDIDGVEYERGMKVLTIPAHQSLNCENIKVKGLKFILPDDISLAKPKTLCAKREFVAKAIAHYVDSGYFCEDLVIK